MNLLEKFKETATSVLPVMAIVVVLGLTVAPLGVALLVQFVAGGILLIVGLAAFLMGVDVGIQPIGERIGASLASKKNLLLLLGVSFLIGFLVTVAEPDIQVFGNQVHSVFNSVNKAKMVYMIALGVGIFVMLGLLKTVLQIHLKILLLVCYVLIFALTFFTPETFIGIAFDSGGATTGPMTVPFIMALGVGVSAVRSRSHRDDTSDNFGLTGITSIGPIAAVLFYGMVLSRSGVLSASVNAVGQDAASAGGIMVFVKILPHLAMEAGLSIAPLALMLVVFQFTLLHLPPRQLTRMAFGLLWSYLGLTIFLVGVNGGFMPAGRELGFMLGSRAAELGGVWTFVLIATGLVLGAVVVCAEPAVWVLTEQVESLSGGTIKRKLMLIFLSAGAAVAIGLAMWRAIAGFSLMRLLVPGYALALVLMLWSPKLFTAIAFDSGGVASGPITSTFVLSFTLGASQAGGKGSSSFGVIALVAMTPLIAIQVLGIIFSRKKKINRQEEIK